MLVLVCGIIFRYRIYEYPTAFFVRDNMPLTAVGADFVEALVESQYLVVLTFATVYLTGCNVTVSACLGA